MGIHWVRKGAGLEISGAAGWSYANQSLQRALDRLGALDDTSPVKVHFCVAGNFEPIPGAVNVLSTMVESEWQAKDELLPVIQARRPDLVVVPCHWNRLVLEKLDPKVPVLVVPLGYDQTLISYKQRRFRPKKYAPQKFRVLYMGAPNYRKYTITRELYLLLRSRKAIFLSQGIDIEFYWKLTGACAPEAVVSLASILDELELDLYTGSGEVMQAVDPRFPPPPELLRATGAVLKDGYPNDDIVIDNRFLPREDLVKLMHSAHLGLCLHGGEGFGLNCLELMASGCPVAVTAHSGTTQFANGHNALLVGWEDQVIDVAGPDGPIKQRVILPDIGSALEAIVPTIFDYYPATVRARRAYDDVKDLTWDASARWLCEALENLGMMHAALPAADRAA